MGAGSYGRQEETGMRLLNELQYSLGKLSSLGSYPFHLLMVILLYRLELVQESLFLLVGFVLVYLLGIPLRIMLFRGRKGPEQQDIFLQRYHASSFPSFHSARIMFLALFISDYFNFAMDVVVISIALVVLVSYARIINRQHFMSDLVGGIVLGIVIWVGTTLVIQL